MSQSNFTLSTNLVITTIRPDSTGVMIYGASKNKKRITHIPYRHLNEIDFEVCDVIKVEGELIKTPYFSYIEASKVSYSEVTADLAFDFIRKSPEFFNIGLGRKKIELLRNYYSKKHERFIRLLNGYLEYELDQLIGVDVANRLRRAWKKSTDRANSISFLISNGLPVKLAKEAYEFYECDLIYKVRENPYRLVPIIGFDLADQLAIKLGYEGNEKCNTKSEQFLRSLTSVTGASVFKHEDLLTEVNGLSEIDECDLNTAIEIGRIIANRGYVTSLSSWKMESAISAYIAEIFGREILRFHDYEIDSFIELYELQNKPTRLSPEQKLAIHTSLSYGVTAITGMVSTGKSEVINALRYVYTNLTGDEVYVVSLQKHIFDGLKAINSGDQNYSLEVFLQNKLWTTNGNKTNISSPLLIIEEASMIGVPELYLLTISGFVGQIVVVGDTERINPKSYGSPLKQIVDKIPTTTLTETHIAKNDDRLAIYKQILNGETPKENGFIKYIVNDLDRVEILACRENAKVICENVDVRNVINNSVQKMQHPYGQSILSVNEVRLYNNDKIILLAGSEKHEIHPGTLGVFKNLDDKGMLVIVLDDGAEHHISYKDACDMSIDLGYAISAYHAQCKRFQSIVILIEESIKCSRNWLYTAVQCGTNHVYIAGDMSITVNMAEPVRLTQNLIRV